MPKNSGCVAPPVFREGAMMEKPSSGFWRNKAEEYRVFAEAAREPAARIALYKLAEDCDALALRQERMARVAVPKAG